MQNLPLRDIHLPEPVGIWPLAIGWWSLILLTVLLSSLFVWWWLHRRNTVPVVKLALRELATLETLAGLSPEDSCRRLSILLRRVCLSLYPRETVAGLTGEDWLAFLDRAFKEPRFSVGAGRHLIAAPYKPQLELTSADTQSLLALCRDWLKCQRKYRKITP